MDENMIDTEEENKTTDEFTSENKFDLHQIETLVTDYIKEHPLQAVGLSLLAGIAAGQIFRKKNK